MDEDFLDVNENSHHIAIIFVLIVVVFAVAGYFLIFKKSYFSLKDLELEVGSTLSSDVEDYLKNNPDKNGDYKLDTSKVNVDEVGEYSYSVTYNKITKNGKIKVVDTTAPVFTLQELIIEEGSTDYYLGDLLATCEDVSKPCLVNIKNSSDEEKLKNVGTHDIEVEISDLYGNTTMGTATIKVVAEGEFVDPRSLDLEYVSNSKKIENFDGTIFKKLEKALNPSDHDTSEVIETLSLVDLERYVRENYAGYSLISSEFVELYNKSSFIIGYSIMLTISNGNEITVYVDPTKAYDLPSISTGNQDESDTE